MRADRRGNDVTVTHALSSQVAAAQTWLASDGASYVNGQVLSVCGGVR